jgi:hypothetical protein
MMQRKVRKSETTKYKVQTKNAHLLSNLQERDDTRYRLRRSAAPYLKVGVQYECGLKSFGIFMLCYFTIIVHVYALLFPWKVLTCSSKIYARKNQLLIGRSMFSLCYLGSPPKPPSKKQGR